MSVTPFKTFTALEVLTASDLNSSFSRIFDNGEDLAWPATKAKDFNAFETTLDADGDSGIIADTDDRIDLKLGTVDLFRFDGTTGSSISGFDFIAAASGSTPSITVVSTDDNVSLNLVPKGTGNLQSNGTNLLAVEDDDYHLSAMVYGG